MAIIKVEAPIARSLRAHSVDVGQRVTRGTVLVILECMKMEIPVEAPCAGEVMGLRAKGDTVDVGDVVATVDDASVPEPP